MLIHPETDTSFHNYDKFNFMFFFMHKWKLIWPPEINCPQRHFSHRITINFAFKLHFFSSLVRTNDDKFLRSRVKYYRNKKSFTLEKFQRNFIFYNHTAPRSTWIHFKQTTVIEWSFWYMESIFRKVMNSFGLESFLWWRIVS